MGVRLSIARARLSERLTLDLGPFGAPLATAGVATARGLASLGRPESAFRILMKLHAAAISDATDRRIVGLVREALASERAGRATGLGAIMDHAIQDAVNRFRTGERPHPSRLIGTRLLVAKTSRAGERGVLVVDYNFMFPLLAGLFNLQAIADRYFIVLEPGWNGCLCPEVLLFNRLNGPIFVETIEPRDRDLLNDLGAPFEPAYPLSTNWWVDHRLAQPVKSTKRDIDVTMIAAWARFKRHWRFFGALAALRRRGHRLKVALVGYPGGMTQADILAEARYFGVADQLEVFERIRLPEVFHVLSRSKIHVIWSRREGSNRAIIEAMLADVPTIVREGFNYGHPYAHVNAHTGRFVPEAMLADAMLEMIERRDEYQPRQWLLEHMTCERAAARLDDVVRQRAVALGEAWTDHLVVKTSNLDGQEYWEPADRARFAADYAWLESQVR
jgi:glycosyltransferase involved in cell wall biosynthesis